MDYSFGNWVKRRRKALDLTQQQLAQRVGCSASAIFKIEADERRPSRQIALLLAQHLEIPSDQIALFLKVARQEKTVDSLGEFPLPGQPVGHHPYSIPLTPNPIIGREFEIAEITRLIQDPHCRMLTLTGQGGIGKTHLATHTAINLQQSYNEHQIAFVSLAAVIGREQTVTAIADALGIVLYSASDRLVQLISYLHDKKLILILDNYEHLAADADCIGLINDILRGTHGIKFIITSRQPLLLQAEWIFEVQGLPVPSGNLQALETNSAVNLFIQRGNQVTLGFAPSNEELLAIARICGLVEGLPLGIELASAWVRMLSCDEIANEIQNSIGFLAISARDLPERHRSIHATIEHSWKLLSTDEQRVMRQLSIFRGGFNRQAAEAVAGASLADLLALVSKSLIRRAESGRYEIHELIHQFALHRLQLDELEYRETQRKHSQYFAILLEQRGAALKGADRAQVVAELVSELPNLRQAWQWASDHQQARDLNLSADTLFWLYESRSNCREGVQLFGKAVDGLQFAKRPARELEYWARQMALGQALSYKGFFLFRQGAHPQGLKALKSSLEILDGISNHDSREYQIALSTTFVFLGTITSVMGDFSEGDILLHKGLRMKQELGDLWESAFCLRQIGLSAHYRGEYNRSYDALEQSLTISREMGNSWSIAASLNQLGIVAHSQGEYDRALKYLSDGLELSLAIEDRASIAVALDGLGLVSATQGKHVEAQNLFQESIALWNEIGEQGSLAQTLIHYGDALLKTGEKKAAREKFFDSLSVASRAQITPILLDALIGETEIRIADGDSESSLALLVAVMQHPSCSHITRSRAENLCSELESQLSQKGKQARNGSFYPTNIDTFVREILNNIPD